MTPDGAYAYVVGEGNGIISVISLATNTVVAAITGLTGADLMAITPNGAYAYISLFMESNTIDVINVLPAANVSPSSWTMDVGQSVQFTANPSDGSGTYTSYQWYVDGVAQSDQTASTFSFSPSFAGSYAITVTVTDSLGITSAQSTAATVTVNSALVAPTVSAFKRTIEQSQDSTLTSSSITTGTSPYTYQWLEMAPSGSYAVVGSNSGSFSFVSSGVSAIGSWSFILQVTDNAGVSVNSSAVSVTVNPTPTPTPTPTPSPTPAPTVTPSPTPASSSSTTQSPTATPTTTATPISTPTQTQSPTPASTSTSSPTSSPTPAVPEFTSAIIVMALFITATTVMLFYTKKPKK